MKDEPPTQQASKMARDGRSLREALLHSIVRLARCSAEVLCRWLIGQRQNYMRTSVHAQLFAVTVGGKHFSYQRQCVMLHWNNPANHEERMGLADTSDLAAFASLGCFYIILCRIADSRKWYLGNSHRSTRYYLHRVWPLETMAYFYSTARFCTKTHCMYLY